MKYVIILGDGMADEPIESLGGRSILEYADTPNMDGLARRSEIGMVSTVPEGMAPGSDTANLSVLGYNPRKYYSGRSPLEALSIGVPMEDNDIALRCNLVTLSEDADKTYAEQTIIDHSSGEISTEDCAVLLEAVRKELENDIYKFYTGTSYRHCMIWKGGEIVPLTPPHDVLGQTIGQYLPSDLKLKDMMERSYEILKNHPLNLERRARGLNPANSCWFWGAGSKPCLDSFEAKTGRRGVMISAVDLLKGIAVGAGMTNIEVEGADGTLNTNYAGKARAAVDALVRDGYDFAYIHIEAPDEMGHQGSVERKLRAVENIDAYVVKNVLDGLSAAKEPFRLVIMPDHPTPIRLRTHVAKPVPYLLYDSTAPSEHEWLYNEKDAERAGNYIANGYELIDKLFDK
ncbi:MAG: cofactor-independent phosphoglycerate mutase [Butyrivibrio sp.]|nr:cofactor-independent phosphoglycerate mutase [Butyrivibrio sp.]